MKILVVEDDVLIAAMIADRLQADGHDVCGLAPTEADAYRLGDDRQPDLAIVDVRLARGGDGLAVGRHFAGRGVPVLYATANVGLVLRAGTLGVACLGKPYSAQDLSRSVALVLAAVEQRALDGRRPPRLQFLEGDGGDLEA